MSLATAATCRCNTSAGAKDSSAPLKPSVIPRQSGRGDGEDKEESRGGGAGGTAMQTALCCQASLREIKAASMCVRLSLGEATPR